MKIMKATLLGALGLAVFSLSGCATGGLMQTLAGAAQGLLGSGAGMTGGQTIGGGQPLGGPISAALPAGPAAPTTPTQPAPGNGGGLQPPADGAGAGGSAVGQRVQAAAYQLPDPFPYADGTENGNLGCADVVCTALETAGVISRSEHNLSVDGTSSLLEGKGWTNVDPPPYQPGDVIVWGPTSGGTHKHIGILVVENGQVYAINNSSSQKKPVKVLLSSISRAVDHIMRAPGGSA